MGDSHVDAEVQRRIEAARRKAEDAKKAREELARARAAGLVQRRRQKLQRLIARGLEAAPLYDPHDNSTPAASGC